MNYDEALQRLQAIVSELETDEAISLEAYKKLASEAREMLTFCRAQLTSIEGELNEIVGAQN